MLEAFKSFVHWLKSLFYQPATGIPTPQEWIKLRKATSEIAQVMGKNELPSQEAVDLSEPERNIEALALRDKFYHTKIFESAKREIFNKLGSFAPSLLIGDLKVEAERAITNFQSSMNDHIAEVFIKKGEYDGRKREKEAFKIENKIKRESNHPKSIILHIGIILTIILIEMVSNAYFFSKSDPLGFVGGFIQALTLAIVGISLAWVTSRFIQQTNHINITRKLFFGLLVLLSASLLVLFVLIVGHLRDFQVSNSGFDLNNISPELLAKSFISNGFVFSLADSYLMTSVILIFNIIAVIDFYKMDDSYPAYGKITKRFEDAFEELNDCRKIQSELLNTNKNKALNEIRDLQKIVETKIAQQANLVAMFNIKEQQYIRDIESIKLKTNQLLDDFRKINLSARKSPAPNYFNVHKIEWEEIKHEALQPLLSGEKLIELQNTFAQTIQESYTEVQAYYLQSQGKLRDETTQI
jgi:hypothetical protein